MVTLTFFLRNHSNKLGKYKFTILVFVVHKIDCEGIKASNDTIQNK